MKVENSVANEKEHSVSIESRRFVFVRKFVEMENEIRMSRGNPRQFNYYIKNGEKEK